MNLNLSRIFDNPLSKLCHFQKIFLDEWNFLTILNSRSKAFLLESYSCTMLDIVSEPHFEASKAFIDQLQETTNIK